ncbi:hypothetical protein [Fischerella sp. PCC 9605]|uniref:hypothetical protein n=1 Tax=Fischerella sp. PCC 9605 TaxID=1173024 RepID=UPI0004AFF34B|nr:hypothetical protein [Fischerella sp. PCC 9605]
MLIQDAITGQITRGTIDNEVIVEQSNIVPVPRDDALAQLHTVQPLSDRSIESLIVEANHLNDSIEGNFETIQSLKETTWSECIRLGDILNVIKSQCPHGEWGKLFRKGSFKFTIRTAQRYMDCANNRTLIAEFAEKEKSLGIKSITRALAGHRKESNKNDTVSHLPEDIQDVEVIEEPQLQQELPGSFALAGSYSQSVYGKPTENIEQETPETTENRSFIESVLFSKGAQMENKNHEENFSAAVHGGYAPIAEEIKRLKAENQRLQKENARLIEENTQLKAKLDEYEKPKGYKKRLITYGGVEKSLTEWEDFLGVRFRISKRIFDGLTEQEALEVPERYRIDKWRELTREEQLQLISPALKSLLTPELKAEVAAEQVVALSASTSSLTAISSE